MKFCSRCGTQLEDNDVFCPSCGEVCDRTDVNNTNNYRNSSQNNRQTMSKREKDTKTLGILSIIFGALGGVVGLILGIICVTRDKNGPYAKLGYIGIALSSVFMLLNIATSILNIVNH